VMSKLLPLLLALLLLTGCGICAINPVPGCDDGPPLTNGAPVSR